MPFLSFVANFIVYYHISQNLSLNFRKSHWTQVFEHTDFFQFEWNYEANKLEIGNDKYILFYYKTDVAATKKITSRRAIVFLTPAKKIKRIILKPSKNWIIYVPELHKFLLTSALNAGVHVQFRLTQSTLFNTPLAKMHSCLLVQLSFNSFDKSRIRWEWYDLKIAEIMLTAINPTLPAHKVILRLALAKVIDAYFFAKEIALLCLSACFVVVLFCQRKK